MHLLGERLLPASESADIAAPALLPEGTRVALLERWWVESPVSHHQRGSLRYCTDGHWLYGTGCIDDLRMEGGIEAAAEQLYRDLFELLHDSGCEHVVRLWNYMAGINAVEGALERYRRFNIGRQQAFLSARRSAFAGAPAACALGTKQGPLTVHFLAGRSPVRTVENPRQTSAYEYPSQYGPRSPSFSRAAVVDLGGGGEALFISGTASIVGHATLHAGDVRRQTEETLDNIEAVLQAIPGQLHRADALDCTIYLRHAGDLAAVREVFERHVGTSSHSVREVAYVRADICRADLLVEIEAQSIVRRGVRA